MTKPHIHDLIIVGGGPGGLTAGIYAQRGALETVLLEKGLPGGQLNNTDTVENWPGTEAIKGADLAMAMTAHAKACGLEIMANEVVEIEPGLGVHTVRLDNTEELHALAVILACGGHPRQLGVPGEQENYGKGVSYCAVCDGFFFKNKRVVVVGGGDTALEEALFLAKIASSVHLVHRRDAFRGSMIMQKRVLAEPKIHVVWDTVVTSVNADPGGVTGVGLKNVQTGETTNLEAEGVFIFIGFEPNNRLVPAGVKMNTEGFVVTSEKCETSLPGIYVIGDLREKYIKQIVTAAAEGCIAAQAVAHYVEEHKAKNG
jgi:thioredoxin reductase (NADPH)